MSTILNSVLTPSFLYSVIRVATPLILASLGAVITSNAGITNIGIEGVMLISALAGVFASAFGFGPWFGLLVAIVTGILCSLAIGYVSMSLKADSVLTCIAFNTMAVGGTVYFMYAVVKDKGTTLALDSGKLPNIKIPGIDSIPVVGDIISNHNIISYVAILMIFVVYVLLYKTPLGLRIRSAGKAPKALSSVGVSLIKTRYIALGISGVLGGMAGAFMSMGYVTWFSKNMTAGRGFIALAADAMGNSTPIGAALSSLLFAVAEALSYSLQVTTIPAISELRELC
jgi:general nucleoside transport system permease protein